MTINKTTMSKNKNCISLDPARKFKFKVDLKGRIQYFNPYFTEFTGYKISEKILKDFSVIFENDTPVTAFELLLKEIEANPKSFFVYKGKTKNGDCYWGFLRSTQRISEDNEIIGYDMEVKLLPSNAIDTFENLYTIINEIEKNAGKNAAEKYLEGFLEEKQMSFKDFVLNAVQINEKKADKYFSIDEDNETKKKKKSWF